ncbi:MAG: UDP binding domain-containing protein, partial [bacterium]|nr:UDP binding domain-containing protein [bacterium]
AGTKWNFLPFRPGLVGGHCIGVDPFYLTTMSEKLGYYPRVILAGRRINDSMGRFVAQKLVKLMSRNGVCLKDARVGVLGITFKENVADLRNSKVPSIIDELKDYGVTVLAHDPLADHHEAEEEYKLLLNSIEEFQDLDACILAVSHRQYLDMGVAAVTKMLKAGAVFVDIKSVFEEKEFSESHAYWSL